MQGYANAAAVDDLEVLREVGDEDAEEDEGGKGDGEGVRVSEMAASGRGGHGESAVVEEREPLTWCVVVF